MQVSFSLLLFIVLLFNVSSLDSSSSMNVLSIDEKIKEEICLKRNMKYVPPTIYNTIKEFVDSLNIPDHPLDNPFFIDFLIKNDFKWSFLFQNGKIQTLGILMITFIIITIIFWISLIISLFLRKGFFRKAPQSNKYSYIFPIVSIVFFVGVLISSCIGMSDSTSFTQAIHGSTCSLLNFFDESIYGNDKDSTDDSIQRWNGMKRIEIALDESLNVIREIKKDYDSSMTDYQKELIGIAQVYKDALGYAEKTYYKMLPGPSDEQTPFYPDVSKEYQSIDNKNTFIGVLYDEYIETIKTPIDMFTSLRESASKISKSLDSIQEAINGIGQHFGSITKVLKQISDNISVNVAEYQLNSPNVIILIFQIINGCFLSFTLLTVIFIGLLIYDKLSFSKIILHVLWNLMIIFIISCASLGLIFSVLGYIGENVVHSLAYILSPDYLLSPDSVFKTDPETVEILNNCLNGDGDLASKMNLKENEAAILDDLYKAFIIHDDARKSLKDLAHNNMTDLIRPSLMHYQKYIENTTTPSDGNNDLSFALESLNKLTDGNCPEVFDYYMFPTQKCKAGYKETEYTNPKKKNCYIINNDQFPSLNYDTCDPSIKELITKKHNAIQSYIKAVDELLDEITNGELIDKDGKEIDYDFGLQYVHMKMKINNELEITTDISDHFLTLFRPVIGNGDLYAVFHCKIIRNDLIASFDQFANYFAWSSNSVGLSCLFGAILGLIGIVFLLITMYYYSSKEHHIESEQKDAQTIFNNDNGSFKNRALLDENDD